MSRRNLYKLNQSAIKKPKRSNPQIGSTTKEHILTKSNQKDATFPPKKKSIKNLDSEARKSKLKTADLRNWITNADNGDG